MQGAKAENVLLSYYYIREKKILPEAFNSPYPLRIMIDSGAHTLQQTEDLGEKYYESYLNDYVQFLTVNKDKIFAAVELDIEEAVGLERVKKWQNKYFRPLEKEGIEICYCWHAERGMKGWTEMCQQYKYVGLSDAGYSIGKQVGMLHTAKKYGAKVHGFAMTKPETLMKVPYYTVDSTRWMTCEQYGTTFIWARNKMIELYKDNKDERKRYKTYFRSIGVDYEKIMEEDPVELGISAVKAWMECDKFINKRTRLKQYWLTPSVPEEATENPSPDIQPPNTKAEAVKSKGNDVPEPVKPATLSVLTEEDRQRSLETRKQTAILNKLSPVLCDNCYSGDACKFYKEGSLCALNDEFNNISPARDPQEAVEKIRGFISIMESRTKKALHFETLDGGYPDKTVSTMLNDMIEYNEKLFNLLRETNKSKDKVIIEGSELLERIFGATKRPQAEEVVEEPPKDVSEGEVQEEKAPAN